MAQASFHPEAHKEQNAVEQIIASRAYVDKPELLPWYNQNIIDLKPETRELFERYCNVPPVDVVSHIKRVRDEAFKIFPYPCLGHWGFLELSIGELPVYNELLYRVKDGEKLLDIGCCLGQAIRKLVQDGAPSEHIYASDLKQDFWDFGYDLFLDKATLKTRFIEADIFDVNSGLSQLDGKVDIVWASSFFHLFDWDGQVKAAKRITQLLKPRPGSSIYGRQGGKADPGTFAHAKKEPTSYWHNEESWARLWKQVSEETDTEWKIDAALGGEDISKKVRADFIPSGTRFLTFAIRRM